MTDNDNKFIVNINERTVYPKDKKKVVLVQYDHNSEIITFETTTDTIEGKNISDCSIQIQYLNVSSYTKAKRGDVYSVNPTDIIVRGGSDFQLADIQGGD